MLAGYIFNPCVSRLLNHLLDYSPWGKTCGRTVTVITNLTPMGQTDFIFIWIEVYIFSSTATP